MIKDTYYDEVLRYVANANKDLKETVIKDGFYEDEKYVKSAGGIAYAGLEKAARWYLRLKNFKQELKDNYAIEIALAKTNRKAMKLFHDGHQLLHKDAYYGDITRVATIQDGLNCVVEFAELLKPFNGTHLPQDAMSTLQKRRLSRKAR